MVDDSGLAATDSWMPPDLRLPGAWVWVPLALGALVIAVGGVVLAG